MLYVPSEPLTADSFPDLTHLWVVVLDTPATFAAFDNEYGLSLSIHLPLSAYVNPVICERHLWLCCQHPL